MGTSPVVLYDDEWIVDGHSLWQLNPFETVPSGDPWSAPGSGLLGAAIPGVLAIRAPVQEGKLRVRIELHEERPPLSESAEDIAEASLHVTGPLVMSSFENVTEPPFELPLGWYRVRFTATEMDEAEAQTDLEEFWGAEDFKLHAGRYLLQLWLASRADAETLRQSSMFAQRYNQAARSQGG